MKIAVIGAGAIGGLVAGYLKLKDEDVSLVAREKSLKLIKEKGLHISGVRGDFNLKIDAQGALSSTPELVILATKTQDIDSAVKTNLKFIRDCLVLTTQNGIRADEIVARYIPPEKIISSIIMFGSTYVEGVNIVHNFEGSWIIGRMQTKIDEAVRRISEVLNKIFPTIITEELKGMKYLKVFVNANNCIPAILGISMQEAFSDLEISRISIAIWKEGLEVVNRAGIALASLPDFPLERIAQLTTLSGIEAAKIYSRMMRNLSKEPLYGSILQSIKRGRSSEIDYINGEFVRLAKENNLSSPLNEKLVKMVHRVEQSKNFFTREELLNSTKGLFD
jgi:2-dehydropantoate 2-reductase